MPFTHSFSRLIATECGVAMRTGKTTKSEICSDKMAIRHLPRKQIEVGVINAAKFGYFIFGKALPDTD
jgi:hypothetical protein